MTKKKSLAKQLKKFTDQNITVKFTWEGGSDSGCYNLFIGSKPADKVVEKDVLDHEEIENLVGDQLGYDSFAGDYYTEGELIYNPKTEAFEGYGHDSTDEQDFITVKNLKVSIPEQLNFEAINILTEGYMNDYNDFHVSAGFVIQNGPVFQEHLDLEEKIGKDLTSAIEKLVSTEREIDRVTSCYNDWEIRRDEMVKDGKGNLVFFIHHVEFCITETQEKYFEIKI